MIFIFFFYWICFPFFMQKFNPCFLMLSSPSFTLLPFLSLSAHTHMQLLSKKKRYLIFLSEIFMIRNKLGTDRILETTRMTMVVRKIVLETLEFLGYFQNDIVIAFWLFCIVNAINIGWAPTMSQYLCSRLEIQWWETSGSVLTLLEHME